MKNKIFRTIPSIDEFVLSDESDPEKLRAALNIAKQKRAFYQTVNRAVPVSGIIIFVVAMLVYWFVSQNLVWVVLGIFYLTVALLSPLFPLGRSFESEIEAIENEIGLQASGAEANEQRAERLFKNHEIDLRKYYRQTLAHANVIFIAGLTCLLLGFSIIGFTYYLVWYAGKIDGMAEKIVASSFGLISGLMVNFVAAIYIRMFSETSKSLTIFHEKLVTTHHLHFANYLSTKVSTEEKRDDVISSIAINLSKILSKEEGENGT